MLSTSSTVEILGRLNAYSIHQAHCFYRDLVLRIPNYTEQEKLIEKMILVNNEWMSKVNIKLTVKDKKYHLDLSNNPLMRVWVPIREMPLTSLNISNCSKLNDAFSVLYNMPLEELNVSNSKIKKYAFLTKLKGLKRLIISHHDVQKPSLKKYAGDIKIIIQD